MRINKKEGQKEKNKWSEQQRDILRDVMVKICDDFY